jgi:hypothetical protein
MMEKNNKNTRKNKNGNLVKIVLLLPRSLSAEEITRTLIKARELCTQVDYDTLPGMPGKFEAWCTPRQAHDFRNFLRHVFKTSPHHDGYDMDAIRSYVVAQTHDHTLDIFTLPKDTKRLNIRYGAVGSYTASMDYPVYREHEELLTIVHKMCDMSPQLWPEVTNDLSLYRQIAVSACLAGYQLGIILIGGMSEKEQATFINRLVEDDLNGKGPFIIAFFAEQLSRQMYNQHVETVEALL